MSPVLDLTLRVRGLSGTVLVWRKLSWSSFDGGTFEAGREGDTGGPLEGDAARFSEEDEATIDAFYDRAVKAVLLAAVAEFAPKAEEIEW